MLTPRLARELRQGPEAQKRHARRGLCNRWGLWGGMTPFRAARWPRSGFRSLEQTSRDSTASSLRARNSGQFCSPKRGESLTSQEASPAPEAAAKAEAKKERKPRRDGAGLLKQDVRAGRLRLRPVWRQAQGGWGTCWPPAGDAPSWSPWNSPRGRRAARPGAGACADGGVLSARPQWPTGPSPPASPRGERGLSGVCPMRAARPLHQPGAQFGGTWQRPSSAPLHQPSPSTGLLFARCVRAGRGAGGRQASP